MRVPFLLTVVTLSSLMAGCSEGPQSTSSPRTNSNAVSQNIFPDRARRAWATGNGSLVNYDRVTTAVRRDAAVWHPVFMSEAPAFRAMAEGSLSFVTPSGQRVNVTYDRHVEHSDGNWTWIGHESGNTSGAKAIITFGENAVFGLIPDGNGEQLQLTTSGGRAWVVESESRTLKEPDGADLLEVADLQSLAQNDGADAAAIDAPAAQAVQANAVATAASTTVDVVVGYTGAFATRLGGQSQAITRLNFLIDVTNLAYADSQVDGRVRMVHAMQVDYPDATSNQSALFDLTGVSCTASNSGSRRVPERGFNCTGATRPSALQSLAQAREQFGADLVAMVRTFQSPENGSCGTAWLLGAGQTEITGESAAFGFSVISDSNGAQFPDDGLTCREEYFAHELGHNMGLQHERDIAQGTDDTNSDGNLLDPEEYGRYPYAFGYRSESASGSFYTIMAARRTGVGYRVFSNPRISSCGGAPCGVTDQADNARSLGQTMPLIAGFRATVIPLSRLRRDINNDGRDDLLWHNPVSSRHGFWLMNGASIMQAPSFTAAPGYTIAAQGDFNGDGRMDVIWTSVQRDLWMLTSTGSGFSDGRFLGSYPSGWRIVAAGDVNADGTDDLVWHNATGAMWGHWFMSNGAIASIHSSPAAPGYRLVTSGYFNADGFLDLLWTSDAGDLIMLTGNGSSFTDTRMAWNYPAGWRIFGAGDVNGDGRDDLLLRNPTQPAYGYWLMDGPAITGNASFAAAPGYFPVTVADFDGDGLADILWSGGSDLQLLSSTGSGFTHAFVGTYADGWRPIDVEVDPN